ncbi:hypothetical protein J6590_074339 [Homalodisca vitripennis]|nr:hypothetical protein J6590_074339 [Homalodisca vitripennis]
MLRKARITKVRVDGVGSSSWHRSKAPRRPVSALAIGSLSGPDSSAPIYLLTSLITDDRPGPRAVVLHTGGSRFFDVSSLLFFGTFDRQDDRARTVRTPAVLCHLEHYSPAELATTERCSDTT